MFQKLPDDLKIYIYQYLLFENYMNIELHDDNLIKVLKLQKNQNSERILRNIKYKLCFYCFNALEINYTLNICSYCKYIIDYTSLYPLVCINCVPLNKKREYVYKKCKLCNYFCGYLGILPYS